MTASEKAKDLVNMYYDCNARSQLQAIEQAERSVLSTLCQKIDGLHGKLNCEDRALIVSVIETLKWWQEVAVELDNMRNALSV